MSHPEKTYWLDSKANVAKVYRGVWALCGLLFLIELLVHKHGDFAIEGWFGFYGWYGFFACVGLVLMAKALRIVLKRPADYYER